MGWEEDFHCNDMVKVNLPWFFSSFFPGLLDWIAFNLVWFERSRTSARVTYQSCLWRLQCGDVTSGTTDVVLRASRWINCKFVLLFWVLYVTSPANFQKVCFPAIYKYYIWNKLTLSFIMAALGASMMIVEIDKPTFPSITSLLMERVEKSPKPVGRIAKTSLPQTKFFKQIFCSSRKDSTAGNVRLRCLW